MYPKKCVYRDNGHDIEPAVDTKTEQKLKVIMTSPDQREGTPLGVRTMEEPRKDNGRTKDKSKNGSGACEPFGFFCFAKSLKSRRKCS